jgi:hypothetical protein
MHIINNIFENLYGTLLNIPGKTKDGIKVRQDMVEMSMRPELSPVEEDGKRTFLPVACYMLSRKEKLSLLGYLQSIKVQTGYSGRCKLIFILEKLFSHGIQTHFPPFPPFRQELHPSATVLLHCSPCASPLLTPLHPNPLRLSSPCATALHLSSCRNLSLRLSLVLRFGFGIEIVELVFNCEIR